MGNRVSPEGVDRTRGRRNQKYSKLKGNCVKKNILFEDPTFPPSGSSLYYSQKAPGDIVWKRPKDIVPDPKFFIDSASADDFAQGGLGNCWFVAACACIAKDPSLWKKIVPDYSEQEWAPGNEYAGIFHFKFWRCGQWEDVVIDDYLPTRSGKLIYTHSKTRSEFWSALLEKAFAKLYGSYEALDGGTAKDAMVDLTGGVAEGLLLENFKTDEEKLKLFGILHKAKDNGSLMSPTISAKSSERETELSVGLIEGHAYSMTRVRNIELDGNGQLDKKVQLIRLRNPWGRGEWKGAWSDGSTEWKKVSEEKKKELGLTFDDEGEFWMSLKDFCEYFTRVDICHMINSSFFSLKKTWRDAYSKGQWKKPLRAGGCQNNKKFLDNPQYLFEVFDDEEEVMVYLEQEDRRALGGRQKGENYTIGVTILKTDINREYRMHDTLDGVHVSRFVPARSVFTRFPLAKGRYLLVPSTFDPGQEGSFVLSIFTSGSMELKELKLEKPNPPSCIGSPYLAVTTVHIVEAEKLGNGNDEMEAYCIVKCEGEEIETSTSKKSLTPTWRERVTLYRKQPQEDIIVEVWKQNVLKDSLMGSVILPMSHSSGKRNVKRRYKLMNIGGDELEETNGSIWLNLRHSTDMDEL